jgi:hypothetical protein
MIGWKSLEARARMRPGALINPGSPRRLRPILPGYLLWPGGLQKHPDFLQASWLKTIELILFFGPNLRGGHKEHPRLRADSP